MSVTASSHVILVLFHGLPVFTSSDVASGTCGGQKEHFCIHSNTEFWGLLYIMSIVENKCISDRKLNYYNYGTTFSNFYLHNFLAKLVHIYNVSIMNLLS